MKLKKFQLHPLIIRFLFSQWCSQFAPYPAITTQSFVPMITTSAHIIDHLNKIKAIQVKISPFSILAGFIHHELVNFSSSFGITKPAENIVKYVIQTSLDVLLSKWSARNLHNHSVENSVQNSLLPIQRKILFILEKHELFLPHHQHLQSTYLLSDINSLSLPISSTFLDALINSQHCSRRHRYRQPIQQVITKYFTSTNNNELSPRSYTPSNSFAPSN